MKRFYSLFLLSFAVFSSHGNQLVVAEVFDGFADVYLQELGSVKGCSETDIDTFKVCSGALRNHGNAPYILHHKETTAKVFVLFHGLSDSPFYLLSIAQSLHQQGHNVVVGLLPGHGKKQADADMQDPLLSDRWRSHVSEVINIVQPLGDKLVLGGFSTGGVLVTEYSLRNPERVDGLLLFSGALALSSSVETFMNIWGIKSLLKFLDGNYQTQGDNPYKYPEVARFSASELMEVILSVRQLGERTAPNLAIWAAHSEADVTTPIQGTEALLKRNAGTSEFFRIEKDVSLCHADLVLNDTQVAHMSKDRSATDVSLMCNGPKANPKHQQMLDSMHRFINKL